MINNQRPIHELASKDMYYIDSLFAPSITMKNSRRSVPLPFQNDRNNLGEMQVQCRSNSVKKPRNPQGPSIHSLLLISCLRIIIKLALQSIEQPRSKERTITDGAYED